MYLVLDIDALDLDAESAELRMQEGSDMTVGSFVQQCCEAIQQISPVHKLQADQLKLVHKGRTLRVSDSLSACGLENWDTLTLSRRQTA